MPPTRGAQPPPPRRTRGRGAPPIRMGDRARAGAAPIPGRAPSQPRGRSAPRTSSSSRTVATGNRRVVSDGRGARLSRGLAPAASNRAGADAPRAIERSSSRPVLSALVATMTAFPCAGSRRGRPTTRRSTARRGAAARADAPRGRRARTRHRGPPTRPPAPSARSSSWPRGAGDRPRRSAQTPIVSARRVKPGPEPRHGASPSRGNRSAARLGASRARAPTTPSRRGGLGRPRARPPPPGTAATTRALAITPVRSDARRGARTGLVPHRIGEPGTREGPRDRLPNRRPSGLAEGVQGAWDGLGHPPAGRACPMPPALGRAPPHPAGIVERSTAGPRSAILRPRAPRPTPCRHRWRTSRSAASSPGSRPSNPFIAPPTSRSAPRGVGGSTGGGGLPGSGTAGAGGPASGFACGVEVSPAARVVAASIGSRTGRAARGVRDDRESAGLLGERALDRGRPDGRATGGGQAGPRGMWQASPQGSPPRSSAPKLSARRLSRGMPGSTHAVFASAAAIQAWAAPATRWVHRRGARRDRRRGGRGPARRARRDDYPPAAAAAAPGASATMPALGAASSPAAIGVRRPASNGAARARGAVLARRRLDAGAAAGVAARPSVHRRGPSGRRFGRCSSTDRRIDGPRPARAWW